MNTQPALASAHRAQSIIALRRRMSKAAFMVDIVDRLRQVSEWHFQSGLVEKIAQAEPSARYLGFIVSACAPHARARGKLSHRPAALSVPCCIIITSLLLTNFFAVDK